MTWFVLDPEGMGYELYDSEKEAQAAFDEIIQDIENTAQTDGRLPDGSDIVQMGKIYKQTYLDGGMLLVK